MSERSVTDVADGPAIHSAKRICSFCASTNEFMFLAAEHLVIYVHPKIAGDGKRDSTRRHNRIGIAKQADGNFLPCFSFSDSKFRNFEMGFDFSSTFALIFASTFARN